MLASAGTAVQRDWLAPPHTPPDPFVPHSHRVPRPVEALLLARPFESTLALGLPGAPVAPGGCWSSPHPCQGA